MLPDDNDSELILPFEEWFESMLLKGRSISTIAQLLNCSIPTLMRLLYKNPHLQEIRANIVKMWPTMIKEKAAELAMAGHPTMLIYLSKTIGGLGDGAQRTDDDPAKQERRVPAMTRDAAKEMIKGIRHAQLVVDRIENKS